MNAFVRIFKIFFLLVSIGWAIYSINAFLFLANTFPGSNPKKFGEPEILSAAQGYLVVFGLAVIAIFLLIIRWPEKR